MALILISWGEDIVSIAWMVDGVDKTSHGFSVACGNITPNEHTYLSWKQDSFQNAFANLLALSSLAQFFPPHRIKVQNRQQH